MAKKRREKTLADYVVIAISPVLIMTLVGSLAFFLLELSYQGQYEMRLKWILFWFVLASVLVARIAIEHGKEHASLFGCALIAVVGLAAIRLVDAFLLAWLLLAISWWCTWKLTWDCTLIDDREDASGEGLLQAAGFSAGTGTLRAPPLPAGETVGRGTDLLVPDTGPPPKTEEEEPNGGGRDVDPEANHRRIHAPGKWVVYFSLAALPLFGVGQLLIPARDTAARAYGFGLLAVYVASALGLLLTTSFLGLRRYLRQRKLQMPTAMAGSWLGMGTALAIALLCLAMLLPQPQGEYTLTALVDKVDAKIRHASRLAVVSGDRAEGEGRRIGQQDRKGGKGGDTRPQGQKVGDQNAQAQQGQADAQQNQGDQKQGGGKRSSEAKRDDGGKKKSDDTAQEKKGEQEPGDRNEQQAAKERQPSDQRQAAGQRPKGEPGAGQRSSPSPPGSSGSPITNLLQSLASYFKWLVYAVLALVAIYLVIRHGSRLREILAQLWAEFLKAIGFWQKQKQAASAETGAPIPTEVRFSAYENPFFSGVAQRMSPAQLVRYTFEALEAWAREQVVARSPEQTPLEFARELGKRVPALAKDVTATADLYVRVAYARKNPSREAVEVLERLWRRMGMGAGV
ncbi:MAG TPA: DUF4129 domain-containing protein [Planctomycetaceae bacterium]|nr:DUF4129 domain-containing protein [Planctomycetaceae bacterium]